MSKEYFYTNQPPNHYYPNSNPHQYQEQHIPVREVRPQSQSQLVIFNGEQPFRDIYHPTEASPKRNLAFIPPKIVKSPSQKVYPIIYNTFNNNQRQATHLNHNQANPIRYQTAENDFHKNISNISDKQQQQVFRRQSQPHTFHSFPAENELQTAKFMHFPQNTTNEFNHNTSSQVNQYQPTYFQQRQQSIPTSYQQMPVHSNAQPQNHFGNSGTVIINKNTSRVAQQPFLNITSPPSQPKRIAYQYHQQQTSFPDERLRASHPNQEHHFYREQQHSKRLQQENAILRGQVEQLGRKQRSFWQQSSHLREQNQRLRELVHNFQRRQKQLLRQRSDYKQALEEQIVKYHQSTLQQFTLLMQRYKLQIQKSK